MASTKIKILIGRAKEIIVKGNDGKAIGRLRNSDDFTDFFTQKDHIRNADVYKYDITPKHVDPKDPKASYTTAEGAVKKAIRSKTGKQGIVIKPSEDFTSKYGEGMYKGTSSEQKIYNKLHTNRSYIVDQIPNEKLVEIASRKNSGQFGSLMKQKDGWGKTKPEQAQLVRDFIREKTISGGKSNKGNVWATGIVVEAAKDMPDLTYEWKRDYGSANYESIESKFHENISTPSKALEWMRKSVRKDYGKPGSPGRKIYDRIKSDNNWNDSETIRFLKTPDGKADFQERMIEEYKTKPDVKKSVVNRELKKHGFGQLPEEEKKLPPLNTEFDQKVIVGRELLGYTGKTSAGTAGISKFLQHKLSENAEAKDAMRHGKDISQYRPDRISYNELSSFLGEAPKLRQLRRAKESGIEITDAPPHIADKLSGVTEKPSKEKTGGLFGKTPKSSGGGSKSSYGGGRRKGGSYDTSGVGYLSEDEVYWSGGRAYTRKKRGKIAGALYGVKTRIPGLRTSEEKEHARADKERKRKKRVEKIFEELNKREDLKYLTREEKLIAAQSDPGKRKLILARGKKMYINEAYRTKVEAKRKEKIGMYASKVKQAEVQSKRRMRAASSPFWRAWYWLSHNTFIFIGIFLAIALLFLPVGLFYVLGWAIAVGVVSLVMFIIWVFMEFWWLIAQAIVAVINFIGQALIGLVNLVGGAISNALGQAFTPFEHILIQNIPLVERDPVTGERKLLGITWGQWNLVPPDFMKLDSFMPTEFDTDVLIVKLWPGIRDLFTWYTQPIADRYTQWISEAEWWIVGATIGIPIVLAVIGIVAVVLYIRRKMI